MFLFKEPLKVNFKHLLLFLKQESNFSFPVSPFPGCFYFVFSVKEVCMLPVIQDCSRKKYIILIEICVPLSTLYEIMSKQIKGFHAAAFFIFLVLLILVSLRLGMGSGHY